MFNFFKKNNDNNIYAPVKGKCLDISDCKDEMFANKVMGDGFLIEPMENIVCSPCDGVLTMIFPTKHAFGVKMENGTEVLVHIGINTVDLNGKYFEELVKENQKVKAGLPIIKCDFYSIKKENYVSSVLVVLTNQSHANKDHIGELVDCKERIIEY